MRKIVILYILLAICTTDAMAQKFPERKDIRSGNTLYEKKKYADSEVEYRRALEKSPDSYEATFNLSNALYKQERYDEAAQLSAQVAGDSTRMDKAPEAYYNQGNALFKQRKLEEALEAYKNALRRNPNDQEAKFNLAYTKKLLEKDQNKDNKNQNKDENKDQQDPNKDQNKDKNDPNKDKQDPNKDEQDPEKEKQDQNQQPKENSMDKSEAENMLNAMQSSEDNTKKKVEGQKVKQVGNSGKNW